MFRIFSRHRVECNNYVCHANLLTLITRTLPPPTDNLKTPLPQIWPPTPHKTSTPCENYPHRQPSSTWGRSMASKSKRARQAAAMARTKSALPLILWAKYICGIEPSNKKTEDSSIWSRNSPKWFTKPSSLMFSAHLTFCGILNSWTRWESVSMSCENISLRRWCLISVSIAKSRPKAHRNTFWEFCSSGLERSSRWAIIHLFPRTRCPQNYHRLGKNKSLLTLRKNSHACELSGWKAC